MKKYTRIFLTVGLTLFVPLAAGIFPPPKDKPKEVYPEDGDETDTLAIPLDSSEEEEEMLNRELLKIQQLEKEEALEEQKEAAQQAKSEEIAEEVVVEDLIVPQKEGDVQKEALEVDVIDQTEKVETIESA